ncbi:cytoplasmic dynein 1 intermediate chain 1-like [Boleophthalmus pectinirostris]|uniref:cytoplasmic dynein 1 intermediate chain 1-like n=1 Tax=Boleophthalmus pectinirostris TaxID=150288 RepID=UPI00242E2143|nr:cytoplasmic dynein 1 intermediate chain 1-like [Boleophthalmus pectinirostris]
MCSWSLDMLAQPQETMELVYNKSKPVAVTCLAFPTGDVNNYVVGSEEGTVYTASRHGSKAGICEMFEGHQGPVTGISCHGAVGPVDFSHLFITSSFDWTVKLWSTKHNRPLYSFEDNADYVYDAMWSPVHPALFAAVDGMGRLDLWNLNNDTEAVETFSLTGPVTSAVLCPQHNRPLYSFEDNADYVYDAMWSPVHPALFAAVDGMGRLDLWNLNNDTEVPTASVTVEGASALNRVRWSSGGKEVAVGDSEGRVWVYDTGELSVPHTDDWARFARTLMEIRASHADGEEEGPMELSP